MVSGAVWKYRKAFILKYRVEQSLLRLSHDGRVETGSWVKDSRSILWRSYTHLAFCHYLNFFLKWLVFICDKHQDLLAWTKRFNALLEEEKTHNV